MKTKALYLTIALATMLGFSSCDLDTFPDDETNAEVLLKSAKGGKTVMNGCYALLKDEIEYQGYASGNTYVRHYFQLSEYPSDNICLSAHTTDPLYEATAYAMNDGLKNVGTLWMLGYKVIYMTNSVIDKLPESDPENKQVLGEAYFMRGLMHLHLVTLFAQPYSYGQNNDGIPLRTSVSTDKTIRNSVGDVYEQIAADFRKAADLLGPSRGAATNKSCYPSHDAALGLLSRVYLYMGKYDECIAVVEEALNGATPDSKLEHGAKFASYFANAKSSSETLFCLGHIASDNKGQSSIGSMYLKDGIGWGEVYPSDPLMYLYERYPSDLRYTSFIVPQFSGKDIKMVYVTTPATDGGAEAPHIKASFKLEDDGAGNYSFTESGKKYAIEARKINGEGRPDDAGEYVEYHVNYDGEDCLCRINKDVTLRIGFTIPMVFVNKFSYQDGDPMLSSPVFCRWGEVILNRAEAYAHKGDAKALEDVNVIRARAGIPAEGMFATDKMHGYDNLLDIVLDERRMELAFEGHRTFDVYRNKKNMDRRYAGAHPFKVVPYTEPHIQYPIPNDEWTASGIKQNPGY